MNFVVCSYGKFQPGDRDEIQETKPKWRNINKYRSLQALLTLVTLLIKLIRILLKWKCIHDKIMPFWLSSFESKANLEFECSYGKIFIRVAKISVTGLRPAFSYQHITIFTKEIGVRGDLGNRSCLVNRTHMKRPLI